MLSLHVFRPRCCSVACLSSSQAIPPSAGMFSRVQISCAHSRNCRNDAGAVNQANLLCALFRNASRRRRRRAAAAPRSRGRRSFLSCPADGLIGRRGRAWQRWGLTSTRGSRLTHTAREKRPATRLQHCRRCPRHRRRRQRMTGHRCHSSHLHIAAGTSPHRASTGVQLVSKLWVAWYPDRHLCLL